MSNQFIPFQIKFIFYAFYKELTSISFLNNQLREEVNEAGHDNILISRSKEKKVFYLLQLPDLQQFKNSKHCAMNLRYFV